MRKLLAIAATIAAVLCSSSSYAGVVYLGTVNSGTVAVNALTSGGSLVTDPTNTVPSAATFSSSFVGSVSGPFDAFLVTPETPLYSMFFNHQVLGIVASNAFTNSAALMPRDLMAEFERSTGISTRGLAGNTNLALEVIGLNFANPDVLNVSGNTITGTSGFSGPDSFIAIVAVPEPSSLAIWGLCAVGAVVAGRSRLRKKSA